MRFSIIRTNKQRQLCVTSKTVEQFLARIAQDDSKYTIDNFRQAVPYMEHGYDGYRNFPTWHRIYPAAEFAKDTNGNLKMKTNNGLLLFSFRNLDSQQAIEQLKHKVSLLPSTILAITGADGKSVEVMVRYSDLSGTLPTDEDEADRLYRIAYLEILPIYQAVVKNQLAAVQPSIRNHFIITVDPSPYYNEKAVAVKVDVNMKIKEDAKATDLSEPSQDTDGADGDKQSKGTKKDIQQMIDFLRTQYQFRYNSVMKYTEYLPKKKGWFDAVQTKLIMESNRQFQVVTPMEQCFNECFSPSNDEKMGSYMTVASIFAELRARFGASLEAKSLLSFGRYLSNMEGLKRKRTRKGTEYLVVKL